MIKKLDETLKNNYSKNEKQEQYYALVIKYKDTPSIDSIGLHLKIIESNGFCWFGKIGKNTAPISVITIANKLPAEVILYSKSNAYRCICTDIQYKKPSEKAYPLYYEDIWKENNEAMSIFFKFISIKKMKTAELEKYIVESNKNNLLHSLKKGSMTCVLARRII